MANILIIGNGGREHALSWKLRQSPKVGEIYVAPGNAGTENNIDINPTDAQAISDICSSKNISLVIIGPEIPLAAGVVDKLHILSPNLQVFGPTQEAAMLESSKTFAKNFMKEFDLPTADFFSTKDIKEMEKFFERLSWTEVVVKDDGLCAGKGVVVPENMVDAKAYAMHMLGSKGDNQVIIEQKLNGYEISALAFVDGCSFARLPLVKDHKRLLESDQGPNTGGMGVVAPVPVSSRVHQHIDQIFRKTIDGLRKRGVNYCGILYAGLMVVGDEPYLLEFNCRFGDPETQVLMRLLESDLFDIISSCITQTLSRQKISWSEKPVIGVILASKNYPVSSDKGTEITSIVKDDDKNVTFHAGTKLENGKIVTNGGRIFCVTSNGDSYDEARDEANRVAEAIEFDGKQYRKDIGKSLISTSSFLSYGSSGVNIDEGNQFVSDIKCLVKQTLLPGTSQIGGFGAIVDLEQCGFPSNSQLVVGIDGVGTKIEVASACQNYSQVGYDVVGMCVNDVICHGARPIAFLDYFVCGKLERKMATQVVESISRACIEAGCSLIGGETAEMPGVYNTNQWDLAGCAIACRSKEWPLLPQCDKICTGDVIIGLTSNGLHSNGFSLARKILEVNGIKYDQNVPWSSEETFGDVLLKGTKLYVKAVLPLLTDGLVKGCAHITGGGLTENAIRVLDNNSDVQLEIDCATWTPPEIFHWLAAAGPVETKEMIRTFNCGIGMALIVSQSNYEQVINHLKNLNESFFKIGEVVRNNDQKTQIKFINESKLFHREKYHVQRQRVKVGILISGTGTNMQKLIEKAQTAGSNCEVVVVISNKETAGGLEIAKSYGVPTKVVKHTADRVTGDLELIKTLDSYGVELVCLGGYMRILSAEFVKHYPSRIINIHPSLLPAFKGAHALEDALAFGAKVVGCSAHFVDELVDHGDIIAQKAVEVEETDDIISIRAKIQKEEHVLFPIAMIKVAAKILNEC